MEEQLIGLVVCRFTIIAGHRNMDAFGDHLPLKQFKALENLVRNNHGIGAWPLRKRQRNRWQGFKFRALGIPLQRPGPCLGFDACNANSRNIGEIDHTPVRRLDFQSLKISYSGNTVAGLDDDRVTRPTRRTDRARLYRLCGCVHQSLQRYAVG